MCPCAGIFFIKSPRGAFEIFDLFLTKLWTFLDPMLRELRKKCGPFCTPRGSEVQIFYTRSKIVRACMRACRYTEFSHPLVSLQIPVMEAVMKTRRVCTRILAGSTTSFSVAVPSTTADHAPAARPSTSPVLTTPYSMTSRKCAYDQMLNLTSWDC